MLEPNNNNNNNNDKLAHIYTGQYYGITDSEYLSCGYTMCLYARISSGGGVTINWANPFLMDKIVKFDKPDIMIGNATEQTA